MSSKQATPESLYRKEPKVYPRDVKGRFASLRKYAVWLLLGLFYFVPWIDWAGRQAVLFDLPGRKFYIFSLTLFPQDFIYLSLLLIMAGLSLFFFTAVAGRLWCGFACPQTVWTEVFLWIERWVEGDRNKRMKLDKSQWNSFKIGRKVLKHFIWIVFALWTGFTFIGFFSPIRELASAVVDFSLGPWELFWGVFYSFATYGNAGFLREQVCKYMCPYARFQSAMFDRDTLVISYDSERGDPRGGRRKTADKADLGLGDCIDCTLCVQVCPTGIDIRNGLQYECIACAACVDVCDQVMDKMGYERGLVRYTTENALEGKTSRILRPRTIVYASLLLILLCGWTWSLTHRAMIRAELIRDRNQLYRPLSVDRVENVYTLKLINLDDRAHRYRISIPGSEQITVDVSPDPYLPAEEVGMFTLRLQAPTSLGKGSIPVEIRFESEEDSTIVLDRQTSMMLPFEP